MHSTELSPTGHCRVVRSHILPKFNHFVVAPTATQHTAHPPPRDPRRLAAQIKGRTLAMHVHGSTSCPQTSSASCNCCVRSLRLELVRPEVAPQLAAVAIDALSLMAIGWLSDGLRWPFTPMPFHSGRRGTPVVVHQRVARFHTASFTRGSLDSTASFTRGSLDSTASARGMPLRLHASCSRSGSGGRAFGRPSSPGPGGTAPTNSARARRWTRRRGRPRRRAALVPARPPPSTLCPAAPRSVSSAATRASACDGARTRAGRGRQRRAPC